MYVQIIPNPHTQHAITGDNTSSQPITTLSFISSIPKPYPYINNPCRTYIFTHSSQTCTNRCPQVKVTKFGVVLWPEGEASVQPDLDLCCNRILSSRPARPPQDERCFCLQFWKCPQGTYTGLTCGTHARHGSKWRSLAYPHTSTPAGDWFIHRWAKQCWWWLVSTLWLVRTFLATVPRA